MGPREHALRQLLGLLDAGSLDAARKTNHDLDSTLNRFRLEDALEEAIGGWEKLLPVGGPVPGRERVEHLRALLSPAPSRRPNENTGLPCEFCGERQKRLSIQRMPDGGLVVHVSERIDPGKVRGEVNGLRQLLKSFADGAIAAPEREGT